MAPKLSYISESFQMRLPKCTRKEKSAIPLILLPEYGQSNANLISIVNDSLRTSVIKSCYMENKHHFRFNNSHCLPISAMPVAEF